MRVFFYYFAVLLLVSFGIQLLILAFLGQGTIERLIKGDEGVVSVPELLLFQAMLLPLVLLVTIYFTFVRDGRPLRAIGLAWPRGTFPAVVFAGTLAAILLGFWRLVAGQLLTFEVSEIPAKLQAPWLPLVPSALAVLILGLLISSFFDEIIFRGYLYSTLRERFPWVHAAGLTNLLYLAFHAGPPEAGAAAMINVFLTGMLLSALRERSGGLVAGVAFQTVWSLVLGSFYSLRLSGYDFPRYQDIKLVGNVELSGGDYGPEGGWLITGVLVLGLIVVAAWVEKGPGEALPDAAPAS